MNISFVDSFSLKLTIFLLLNILGFSWSAIVGMSLPAITAHGKFKKSISDSFHLLRNNPKRYLKTWSKFYIICYLPSVLILYIYFLTIGDLERNLWIVMNIFYILAVIYSAVITTPMYTLVRTRLYNSLIEDNEQQEEVSKD